MLPISLLKMNLIIYNYTIRMKLIDRNRKIQNEIELNAKIEKIVIQAFLKRDITLIECHLDEDGLFNGDFKSVFMLKLKYALMKYPIVKSYYKKGYSLDKLTGQSAHQFIYEECQIKNFLEVLNEDNFESTISTEFDTNNEIRTKLNKNEFSLIISFSFEKGKIKSLEYTKKTLTQKSLYNQINNN